MYTGETRDGHPSRDRLALLFVAARARPGTADAFTPPPFGSYRVPKGDMRGLSRLTLRDNVPRVPEVCRKGAGVSSFISMVNNERSEPGPLHEVLVHK
jgi:hypothetical protein